MGVEFSFCPEPQPQGAHSASSGESLSRGREAQISCSADLSSAKLVQYTEEGNRLAVSARDTRGRRGDMVAKSLPTNTLCGMNGSSRVIDQNI